MTYASNTKKIGNNTYPSDTVKSNEIKNIIIAAYNEALANILNDIKRIKLDADAMKQIEAVAAKLKGSFSHGDVEF